MVQREFYSTYAATRALEKTADIEAFALRHAGPEMVEGLRGSGDNGDGAERDGAAPLAGMRPRQQRQQLVGFEAVGGAATCASLARGQGRTRRFPDSLPALPPAPPPPRPQALSNLVRVRMLVEAQRQRLARERTAEFLEAAGQGAVARLRAVRGPGGGGSGGMERPACAGHCTVTPALLCAASLCLISSPSSLGPFQPLQIMQQGLPPDSADYDGRTALELAAAHGHVDAVKLLLAAGANPSRTDNLQGCPLLEAARAGHDEVLDTLRAAGGVLSVSQVREYGAADAHRLPPHCCHRIWLRLPCLAVLTPVLQLPHRSASPCSPPPPPPGHRGRPPVHLRV
jgi:hypothetical protein